MDEPRFEVVEEEHICALAISMRPEDAAEVLASCGSSPYDAIAESVDVSTVALSLFAGDDLLAVFGLVEEAGVAWVLTARAVDRHRKAFLRASRIVVAEFLERCVLLHNVIDARYAAALRWVRHLGFEVGPAFPLGPAGLHFHHVVLRRA